MFKGFFFFATTLSFYYLKSIEKKIYIFPVLKSTKIIGGPSISVLSKKQELADFDRA